MQENILYNKNTPVLKFTMDSSGDITNMEGVGNDSLLPLCIKNDMSPESLSTWLRKRGMPKNREGLGNLKDIYGDIIGKDPNLFSLSDQYWIKTKNEQWKRLNFFTNDYSSDIGDMFFMPWEINPKKEISYHSPDLTTNGILKKTWIKGEDGTNHLIKASSPATHQEPLNEVLSSIVMEKLNIIPFVRYDLCVHGTEICSVCDNFVTENTEFIPAMHVYATENRDSSESVYEHLLRMCEKFNISGAKEYVDNMILIDYITGNQDRHLGNFGFLRTVDGENIGELVFAPLFDSGSAFWNAAPDQKRKIFGDVEKKIVRSLRSKYNVKQFASDYGYRELIMSYPGISSKTKERIIKKTRERGRELNQKDVELSR